MHRTRSLSLLFISLYASVCAGDNLSQHWQDPAYIEQSFINISFGREYSKQATSLNKWDQPIRVNISDTTDDSVLHQQLITLQLSHLTRLSGQTFLFSSSSTIADMHIYFLSEADYLAMLKGNGTDTLLKSSVCLAQIKTAELGRIEGAKIWIPVERARSHGKLLSCIVEETTQALGLINDSEKVFPSIFNDHSHHDFLTGLDLILIQLLYLDELKPGMTEKQVRQVIRKALDSASFQSRIKQAEQQVRQGSLETLLNP